MIWGEWDLKNVDLEGGVGGYSKGQNNYFPPQNWGLSWSVFFICKSLMYKTPSSQTINTGISSAFPDLRFCLSFRADARALSLRRAASLSRTREKAGGGELSESQLRSIASSLELVCVEPVFDVEGVNRGRETLDLLCSSDLVETDGSGGFIGRRKDSSTGLRFAFGGGLEARVGRFGAGASRSSVSAPSDVDASDNCCAICRSGRGFGPRSKVFAERGTGLFSAFENPAAARVLDLTLCSPVKEA